MDETFKKNHKGFVLISATLVMALLVLLVVYVISFTITELKISDSQIKSVNTYYLAESGINEMMWKIKNDPSTRNAFLNGTLDASYSINRNNVFEDNNASYQVSATNTVTAEAWITATSTYQSHGRLSQRVVKSYISKATGDNTDWNFCLFSGGRGTQNNGNFTINGSGTGLTVNSGRLHANQDLKAQGVEVIVNDGAVTASNNVLAVAGGIITLNNSYQDSPTSTVDILQIDFASSNLSSWKNRATATYTENEFKNLPDNTILSGIIYVTGDVKIENKNITINGVLVAESDVEITTNNKTVTINADPVYGGGILSPGDVEIDVENGTIKIDGLLYAGDYLEIESDNEDFTINGGLAGFDVKITASNGSIILNFEPDNFQSVIDPIFNQNSPLIQIDHWEEEY